MQDEDEWRKGLLGLIDANRASLYKARKDLSKLEARG